MWGRNRWSRKTGSPGMGNKGSCSLMYTFQDLMEECLLEETYRFLEFTVVMLLVIPEKTMGRLWTKTSAAFSTSQLYSVIQLSLTCKEDVEYVLHSSIPQVYWYVLLETEQILILLMIYFYARMNSRNTFLEVFLHFHFLKQTNNLYIYISKEVPIKKWKSHMLWFVQTSYIFLYSCITYQDPASAQQWIRLVAECNCVINTTDLASISCCSYRIQIVLQWIRKTGLINAVIRNSKWGGVQRGKKTANMLIWEDKAVRKSSGWYNLRKQQGDSKVSKK